MVLSPHTVIMSSNPCLAWRLLPWSLLISITFFYVNCGLGFVSSVNWVTLGKLLSESLSIKVSWILEWVMQRSQQSPQSVLIYKALGVIWSSPYSCEMEKIRIIPRFREGQGHQLRVLLSLDPVLNIQSYKWEVSILRLAHSSLTASLLSKACPSFEEQLHPRDSNFYGHPPQVRGRNTEFGTIYLPH